MNYHWKILRLQTSRCSAGQRCVQNKTNGRPGVLDKKNWHDKKHRELLFSSLAPCVVRRAIIYIAHAPVASTTIAGLPSGTHK